MAFVYEPMEMTGLINISQDMSGAGAALRKTSGSSAGWDATASSTECIESLRSFRRGLHCKLSHATGTREFMIGFMTGAACLQHPGQSVLRDSVRYQSITFAAHISQSGHFNVFESGKHIGDFGNVKAGDTIQVQLTDEDLPTIRYCVNGEVRYASKEGTSKQGPLFGKVCAHYQSPLVEDLQWIIQQPSDVEGEVVLTGFTSGVVRNPLARSLSKVQHLPGNAFNAWVRSKDCIESIDSDRSGLSFIVSQSEKDAGSDLNFAVGFTSDPDQGSSLESLTHATHIQGGSFKVYEKGVMQGEFDHHVKVGDRIDMVLALDEECSQPKIQYYVNRKILGEIQSEVHFPLYAKVCAMSHGEIIKDFRWIDRNQFQAPLLRHVASPAWSLNDDAAALVSVQKLETTMSQLLAEVGALKGAAEEHVQAREAARVEEATLEAKLEEMQAVRVSQLHAEIEALKTEFASWKDIAAKEQARLLEASRLEQARLEAKLDEVKAELAAEKEASIALVKEKTQWQAERDALLAASEEKPRLCARSEGPLRLKPCPQEEVHLREENDALRGAIDSLEEQLRMEEAASRVAVDGKNELQVSIEKQKEEIKAGSAALLALTKENAHLKVQLEGEKERSGAIAEEKVQLQSENAALRSAMNEQEELQEQLKAEKAASCAEANDKVQHQIRAKQLQAENRELHKVTQEMTEEKVRLQMQEKLSRAELQELRRQLLQNEEPSVISWTDDDEEGTNGFATSTGGSIA